MLNFISTLKDIAMIEELARLGVNSVIVSDKDHATMSDGNFDWSDIVQARKLCNNWGLKLYVRCDALFFDRDLPELRDYLEQLIALDVDMIYFADLAVYMIAKEWQITERLIYDPQTLLTNSEDVRIYEHLGVGRCVPAKELTWDEQRRIAEHSVLPSEMIVFGYLRMSQSRRQILSGYQEAFQTIGLHEHRQLTAREVSRTACFPLSEDHLGTYTYSPYVFDSIKYINDITPVIANIRFDGLFLGPEVLADALRTAKMVIDGADPQTADAAMQARHPELNFGEGFMFRGTNL